MAAPRISSLFLLAVAALLLTAVDARAGCVTANCHVQLGRGKVVHAPVADGECRACHQSAGKAHPGQGSMALTAKEPELCLNCHDNPTADQPHVHPPVTEGCTPCHHPHQSAQPRLLRKTAGLLCLDCHVRIVTGMEVHGPVRAGNCTLCHAPHASAHAALLTREGNNVCFSCHVKIEQTIATAKSQHEPVARGRCWECHAPHASDSPPLLRAAYPSVFYVPYRPEEYALCFSCHPREAMEYDLTSDATAFRNRGQNLHYLHVRRGDKGRVCRSCHGVHGADQGKLLLSRIEHFGRWGIPLHWVEADGGGTCYVGCHRPKSYDRVSRKIND